ncbi:MAG: putative toxin-antitoxin system toxin component, PIN family [Gammaproteobacteria bacterium]|nr:putative toxin-antitoxin system toxin component, PIN family [Gammaproteobacteria bacterium]
MQQRIVVDTNVLVSAIRSADGAAREVLRRCLNGDAEPLIGNALFLEYEDVLSRDRLFEGAGINAEERSALLDAVLSVCRWTNVAFLWRPNLPDEADNHLIELAVAGNADWIITRNRKDVAGGELKFDSFGVLTPDAWLRQDED